MECISVNGFQIYIHSHSVPVCGCCGVPRWNCCDVLRLMMWKKRKEAEMMAAESGFCTSQTWAVGTAHSGLGPVEEVLEKKRRCT